MSATIEHEPLTERDQEFAARMMRDAMYSQVSSDANWESCKAGWKTSFDAFVDKLAEHGMRIIKEK